MVVADEVEGEVQSKDPDFIAFNVEKLIIERLRLLRFVECTVSA